MDMVCKNGSFLTLSLTWVSAGGSSWFLLPREAPSLFLGLNNILLNTHHTLGTSQLFFV